MSGIGGKGCNGGIYGIFLGEGYWLFNFFVIVRLLGINNKFG